MRVLSITICLCLCLAAWAQEPSVEVVAGQEKAAPPQAFQIPQPVAVQTVQNEPEERGGELPSELDEMIEIAMDRNPQIAQARAALHQAEADLNEVQMRIAREVSEAHARREYLAEMVERVDQKFKTGVASSEELIDVKGKLSETEAGTRYLLGMGPSPHLGPEAEMRGPFERERARVPVQRCQDWDDLPEDLQAALEMPLSIEFDGAAVSDILDFISEYAGPSIVPDMAVADMVVDVRLEDLPLEKVLLALTDRCEDLCFVLRDYGIFATTRGRAEMIDGPTIPADVPLYKALDDVSLSHLLNERLGPMQDVFLRQLPLAFMGQLQEGTDPEAIKEMRERVERESERMASQFRPMVEDSAAEMRRAVEELRKEIDRGLPEMLDELREYVEEMKEELAEELREEGEHHSEDE